MRRMSILATGLLAAAALPADASDLIVLESNVPAYAAGASVPSGQAVNLDEDARLVIIAGDGTTRTVEGPYQGPIGRAGTDAPGAIERLTTQRENSNHVVGAIRAPKFGDDKDGKPAD